jgi:hypothetical protein
VGDEARRNRDATLRVEGFVPRVEEEEALISAIGLVAEGAGTEPILESFVLLSREERDAGVETAEDDEGFVGVPRQEASEPGGDADSPLVVDGMLVGPSERRHPRS